MKLDLYLPNLSGIYLEPFVLRLCPSASSGEKDFICPITESQYERLYVAVRQFNHTQMYPEIERVLGETQIDIPLWLLAEKGIGEQ